MARQVIGLVATVVVVAACAGCTAAAEGARRGSAPTTAPDSRTGQAVSGGGAATPVRTPWAREHPPPDCTVTVGSARTAPPATIDTGQMPVPYIANWYGTTTLWTRLPPTGVLPAQVGEPGELPWDTKYPWWRTVPGRLTISARHLAGGPASFAALVPSGYGATGFQSTSLQWSALGCWQVTATNAGRSVTFTVWVEPLAPG
jgi:hypothetical protein